MYAYVCVCVCMSQAVPHVTSWRGSKSSSWSLMAHLWRSEEADISVSRGHLGTLEGMHSAPPSGPAVVCGCVCTNWPSTYVPCPLCTLRLFCLMNPPLHLHSLSPHLLLSHTSIPFNPCPPSFPFTLFLPSSSFLSSILLPSPPPPFVQT